MSCFTDYVLSVPFDGHHNRDREVFFDRLTDELRDSDVGLRHGMTRVSGSGFVCGGGTVDDVALLSLNHCRPESFSGILSRTIERLDWPPDDFLLLARNESCDDVFRVVEPFGALR